MGLTNLFNRPDQYPALVIASNTSVTLAPTLALPMFVSANGSQYFATSTLTCNLSTTGAGGLDTGSLVALTLYYVYAVVSAGALALVASTSPPSTGPSGFTVTRSQLVGAFYTDQSSHAAAGVTIDGIPKSAPFLFTPSTISFTNNSTVANMRREGQHFVLHYHVVLTGAQPATIFFVSMPGSYLIDSSALTSSGSNNLAECLGPGMLYQSSSGKRFNTACHYNSTSDMRLGDTNAVSTNQGLVQNSTPINFTTNDVLDFTAVVPISGLTNAPLRSL